MAQEPNADPLNVVIVGAGIGGLTAAIGLRQQGHKVTLFERSSSNLETGAALHIAPNCHCILKRFGMDASRFGATLVNGFLIFKADGTQLLDQDMRGVNAKWGNTWVMAHRVGLHNELKRMATSAEGEGEPAILKTSSRVVDVDTSNSTVTLEDGTKVSGDLILGADGVGSVVRKYVCSDELKPFGSGRSAFRFLIPRQRILDDPTTQHLGTKREGYFMMWAGGDRLFVMYPCDNNTVMNCVAVHPSEMSAAKGEGWHQSATKETLLKIYEGFEPSVRTLLELADSESLKVWTLLDMDRIPRWVKGNVALLGDAAHPFLPYQGQGGGVAVEDAASLSALLPRGTQISEIPERLALYEKTRDGRAHKIQEITRTMGSGMGQGNQNMFEFFRYLYSHDEWINSAEVLKGHLSSQNEVEG